MRPGLQPQPAAMRRLLSDGLARRCIRLPGRTAQTWALHQQEEESTAASVPSEEGGPPAVRRAADRGRRAPPGFVPMSEAFLQGAQHAPQQQRQTQQQPRHGSSPRRPPPAQAPTMRRQRRPPPAELQWGDAPPRGRMPARRPQTLTHRERVRLMLQSNNRMKFAYAAVEDALQEDTSEPTKLAAARRFVAELARIAEEGGAHFDCVNVATCLHDLIAVTSNLSAGLNAAVTSDPTYTDLVSRLIAMAEAQTPSTKLPTVFNLLWSVANARPPIAVSQQWLDGLAERVTARMREPPLPESKYLAGTLHGFSRIVRFGEPSPKQAAMLDALYGVAPQVLGECSFQNLANLAYSMAILRHPPPRELLVAIAETALLFMPRADPQGVANIMWAYATLKVNPLEGQLFRAAIAHAGPRLDQYNPQNLANVLWSLAVTEHRPPRAFLDALAASALQRMRDFSPQHLANSAWACARLGYSPMQGQLVHAIIGEATVKLPALSRQNLCNILWACVALQHPLSPEVLQSLSTDWAGALLRSFDTAEGNRAQHVSNAAWSYARLRLNPLGGALLDAAAAAALEDPAAFSLQNFSNIVLAFGILQHPLPQPFIDLVTGELLRRGSFLENQQNMANVLWGLAALDALQPSCLAEVTAWLDQEAALEGMVSITARQLAQADLVARQATPGNASVLPARLRQRLKELDAGMDKIVVTSRLQEGVSDALAGMGIPHAVEARVSCPDYGDAVVDILIEAPGGARIAVEVDGPAHYTALPPHRNLGHTALRNRLLEARGLKVVQVPFRDGDTKFFQLADGGGAKEEYLARVMAEAGVDIAALKRG